MGAIFTKKNLLILVLIIITAYLLFYSFAGDRGLLKYISLQKQISEANGKSEVLQQQKTQLEQKVKLLSDKSLDLDMLEEQARKNYKLVDEDEFVILDSAN